MIEGLGLGVVEEILTWVSLGILSGFFWDSLRRLKHSFEELLKRFWLVLLLGLFWDSFWDVVLEVVEKMLNYSWDSSGILLGFFRDSFGILWDEWRTCFCSCWRDVDLQNSRDSFGILFADSLRRLSRIFFFFLGLLERFWLAFGTLGILLGFFSETGTPT